jgi:ribosomal protein S18 acetylase RimI-like enzyme
MNAAAQHARQTGAIRIELENQADNAAAQALYAELGYVENTGFRHYALNPVSANEKELARNAD